MRHARWGASEEAPVNIYYARQFWFDNFVESAGTLQRAFITLTDINRQNVKITAQLNVFGPGAFISIDDGRVTGDLGSAAVGIKWYEFIDGNGDPQHVDNSYFA